MPHPSSANKLGGSRLGFDRHVLLKFHDSKISSDGGLLLYSELDDAIGLHDFMGEQLQDTRTGYNLLHIIVGLSHKSTFGRLAGYEVINLADRLAFDPVMRQIVGGRAIDCQAASASQIGRFKTEVLTSEANLSASAGMRARWIDRNLRPSRQVGSHSTWTADDLYA